MHYLHKSVFQSHGYLSSANCHVDSRWVLKISGFALHAFGVENYREQVSTPLFFSLYQWKVCVHMTFGTRGNRQLSGNGLSLLLGICRSYLYRFKSVSGWDHRHIIYNKSCPFRHNPALVTLHNKTRHSMRPSNPILLHNKSYNSPIHWASKMATFCELLSNYEQIYEHLNVLRHGPHEYFIF